MEDNQIKILELWETYMAKDKRSFDEFFSEEFSITLNEDIDYKTLELLLKVLIPRAKTYRS